MKTLSPKLLSLLRADQATLGISDPHSSGRRCTKSQDVARLINTDTADFVFTDPPYNCDYEGYTEERPTIQGDRMTGEQFSRFLADSFANYQRIVRPGASLYVFHSSARQREFQNALENAGLEVRCQIIWVKNTFA
jgi:DNA modification methylase